jgi:hypothetical protein
MAHFMVSEKCNLPMFTVYSHCCCADDVLCYIYFSLRLMLGDLKRVCEIDLGIVSQCCCAKQVFKMNKQIHANLALKINVKVSAP